MITNEIYKILKTHDQNFNFYDHIAVYDICDFLDNIARIPYLLHEEDINEIAGFCAIAFIESNEPKLITFKYYLN